jgi:hypothetical protein
VIPPDRVRILARPHQRNTCPPWRRQAHEYGTRLCWTASGICVAGGLGIAAGRTLLGAAVILAAIVLLVPAAFLLGLPSAQRCQRYINSTSSWERCTQLDGHRGGHW